MADTAIGVDIGGTNIRAALVSAQGEILAKLSERTPTDPMLALERVIAMARALDAPGVLGIGVGIPGRVDIASREILSGGILNLSGLDFVHRIEAALGKPVVIENDCSMALIAEMRIGGAKGYQNVAMLTIGTGIGGAVAHAGRIYH